MRKLKALAALSWAALTKKDEGGESFMEAFCAAVAALGCFAAIMMVVALVSLGADYP